MELFCTLTVKGNKRLHVDSTVKAIAVAQLSFKSLSVMVSVCCVVLPKPALVPPEGLLKFKTTVSLGS